MERVCPEPGLWHETVERLKKAAQARGLHESPPVPLILGGWAYSNDVQKKSRWEATVEWARRHGLESELPSTNQEFYTVAELYDGMVGPTGGPMYLPWRFDPASRPDHSVLVECLSVLQNAWESFEPTGVVAVTKPLRFTGSKARRLEVSVADGAPSPPWGTWAALAHGPERRSFTNLRAAINRCIAPHEIDHVGFVFE